MDGETQMHNVARWEAMRGHDGVPDEALRYVPVPAADPVIEVLDPVELKPNAKLRRRAPGPPACAFDARWKVHLNASAAATNPLAAPERDPSVEG